MFDVTQAMRYNSVETVDAEFSAILAEINYTADLFEPGVTYSNEIEEKAGQVFVRKLGKSAVNGTDATAAGGLKFESEETADSLLPMNKIYTLSASELCPSAIDAARKSGKLAQKKEVVVRAHNEAWNAQGVALLLGGKNGGTVANNHTVDADDSAPTSETIVDMLLAVQQQILEADTNADTVLVSPEVRTMLLTKFAQGKGFLPQTNEDAKRRGVIGDLLGMTVKVTNFLGKASNIRGKIQGDKVHADVIEGAALAKRVDFIVYDSKTWYMDDVFTGMRENPYVAGYFGSSVDIQTISGALNTNPERCIAHIRKAS